MAGVPETRTLTCAYLTPAARFQVNINGFLKRQQQNKLQFTVGNEVRGPNCGNGRTMWIKDSGLVLRLLPTQVVGST